MTAISAVAAYQRALDASRGIQPTKGATAVLRKGDDITGIVTDRVSIGGAQKASRPDNKSFGAILEREVLKAPIDKIKSGTKTMFEIAKSSGTELGPNLVQLVEAVSSAQLTVNSLVEVRDKILAAYNKILDMPL